MSENNPDSMFDDTDGGVLNDGGLYSEPGSVSEGHASVEAGAPHEDEPAQPAAAKPEKSEPVTKKNKLSLSPLRIVQIGIGAVFAIFMLVQVLHKKPQSSQPQNLVPVAMSQAPENPQAQEVVAIQSKEQASGGGVEAPQVKSVQPDNSSVGISKTVAQGSASNEELPVAVTETTERTVDEKVIPFVKADSKGSLARGDNGFSDAYYKEAGGSSDMYDPSRLVKNNTDDPKVRQQGDGAKSDVKFENLPDQYRDGMRPPKAKPDVDEQKATVGPYMVVMDGLKTDVGRVGAEVKVAEARLSGRVDTLSDRIDQLMVKLEQQVSAKAPAAEIQAPIKRHMDPNPPKGVTQVIGGRTDQSGASSGYSEITAAPAQAAPGVLQSDATLGRPHYDVIGATPGRALLIAPGVDPNVVISVKVGDDLDGYGKVEKISPEGTIYATNGIIKMATKTSP